MALSSYVRRATALVAAVPLVMHGVSLVKLLANGHKRIIYTSRAYDLCDRLR